MRRIGATVAKHERVRISQRVKAGLETARAKGKRLGRPRVVADRAKIGGLPTQGLSWAKIAAQLGIVGKAPCTGWHAHPPKTPSAHAPHRSSIRRWWHGTEYLGNDRCRVRIPAANWRGHHAGNYRPRRSPGRFARCLAHALAYGFLIHDSFTYWDSDDSASNSVVLDPIRVQLRPKLSVLRVNFERGKPVKPTASTGFMERAMGIEQNTRRIFNDSMSYAKSPEWGSSDHK